MAEITSSREVLHNHKFYHSGIEKYDMDLKLFAMNYSQTLPVKQTYYLQSLRHLVFKSIYKSIQKSNKTYLHFGHCANMSLHPTKILLYLSVIKNIREWCFVMCRHLSPHQSRDSSFPNPLIYFFILCTYPITCALTDSHMLL